MADTNITIVFTNGQEVGTASNPETPGSTPELQNPTEQKEPKGKSDGFATKTLAKYLINTGINMAVSRVGVITGDSVLQGKVNAGMKAIQYATAFAINPVLGAINIGVDMANQMIDTKINKDIESYSMEVIHKRAGNSNRSR